MLRLEQFTRIWATLAEYISKAVERAHDLPANQLRFVAALACFAFVLVAWVSTLRKLRMLRKNLVEAQAQSEEMQAKYDAEVKWRTATKRVEAAKTGRTTSAAAPEPAQQPAGVADSASDQKQEISEIGISRKANTLRALSLMMSLLALVGWGAFAYAAKSSVTAQHQLRKEVAQLKAAQDQLRAERDQAMAQVATAQQEVTVLQKRLEERPETRSVPTPVPSGKPVRSPEQTKSR